MKTDRATSRRMARQKTRGTRPERVLRAALAAACIRAEANVRGLPGTPDLVVRHPAGARDLGVAVFVHGCFWHACPAHWKPPARNRAFWLAKAATNAARHRAACGALRAAGWVALTYWEHEVCSRARLPLVVAAIGILVERGRAPAGLVSAPPAAHRSLDIPPRPVLP